MKRVLNFRNLVGITLFVFSGFSVHATNIRYINISAQGSNDGTSWTNAYLDLQPAIDASETGDEIWVAAGTYFPTITYGDTTNSDKTFFINKRIKLFGGFEGNPGSEGHFESRDVVAHRTILSGDIGVVGSTTDNVFHVIWLDHVGFDMVLDGFTIQDGFGGTGGGALFNDGSETGSSSPVIANCVFRNNTSGNGGGAVMNLGSNGEANPVMVNCSFTNNVCSGGGAMLNLANPGGNASPILINCQFLGNTGLTASGGAVLNIGVDGGISSPQLFNCLFSGNQSVFSGAFHSFANTNGICNPYLVNCTFSGNSGGSVSTAAIGGSVANAVIRNSIFWKNTGESGISQNGATTTVTYSLIPFEAFPGEGNISQDPKFVTTPDVNLAPTLEGDLHLSFGSPAINAGDNSALDDSITTDLDGLPRITPENGGPGVVDMGVYEFPFSVAVSEVQQLDEWTISPNPASSLMNIHISSPTSYGWLRVFDIQGRMVMQHFIRADSHGYPMVISHLSSGTYLMQMIINGRMSTKQIVIQ